MLDYQKQRGRITETVVRLMKTISHLNLNFKLYMNYRAIKIFFSGANTLHSVIIPLEARGKNIVKANALFPWFYVL